MINQSMKQRKTSMPTRIEYCGWNEIPPSEFMESVNRIANNPNNCHPNAEYLSWEADCYETNHDENGQCVGELWPGYVTFEAWKKRCAKRRLKGTLLREWSGEGWDAPNAKIETPSGNGRGSQQK